MKDNDLYTVSDFVKDAQRAVEMPECVKTPRVVTPPERVAVITKDYPTDHDRSQTYLACKWSIFQ